MPAPFTAPRRHRARRRALGAALGLAAILGAAACDIPGSSPGTGATADGLLALTAGADTETRLTAWKGADPDGIDVDLPHGRTTWISVGRANVLAATVEESGPATSDPLRLGTRLVWRFVDAEDANGAAPPGPAWFGTWDPGGQVVAELAGDIASGEGVAVVLIDPSDGMASTVPIDRSVVAGPPAWISAHRLVIVTREADSPTSVIVDTASGELTDGPVGARLVATSANLARVATMAGPGEPVIVRDLGRWLAGDTATLGSFEPPDGASTAVAFALDTTGQRLAIAWLTDTGSIALAVHDGRSGWRRTGQPTIDVSRGAALAWQR